MRKSLIMGTKLDVLKRRTKQSNATSVSTTNDNSSLSYSSKRIVTFNHPLLLESNK